MAFLKRWPFGGGGIPRYAADNIVARGTKVRGDLAGPGGFRIEGDITGTVEATGPVVIGAEGSVEGSVRARDVVVLGCVNGDVHASGHLEIGPHGRVLGDVTVTSIRVHDGGTFHGVSRIGDAGDAPRLALPASLVEVRPGPQSGVTPKVRTLPPPLGGVPPPAPSPFLTPSKTMLDQAQSAPRASGETRIEPVRDAAVNDSD
jgi:cytoskeletal protein CcmA (bactofilin family)